MTRLGSITLLAAAALTPAIAAPSADEILSKARKALGKVDGLQALTLAGTRRVAIDSTDSTRTMTREVELDFLLPDKFYKAETMELPNGMEGPTLVEALNGETSWRDTQNMPTGGNIMIRVAPPPGVAGANSAEVEKIRTKLLRHTYLRTLLLYTLTPPVDANLKFEAIGEAETANGKAWMIDVSGPEMFAMRIFIDQKSNLPMMASWRGLQAARPMIRTQMAHPGETKKELGPPVGEMPKPKEVDFELRIEEYTNYSGLNAPKLTTLMSEGKTVEEFELKSAKLNPKLKADKFRK